MADVSVLNYPGILNESIDVSNFKMETTYKRKPGFNTSIIKMIADGGENFFLYLTRHNFSNQDDMLVLPSVKHYYYDENELKDVKTLVNLRKLNHIKNLDKFFHTLFQLLPPEANFIGCFTNDKEQKENGLPYYKPSRLLNRFTNFIDSRTDHILNKEKVLQVLEKNGHKIVDMTEMNGLTYFYSKKVRLAVELRA